MPTHMRSRFTPAELRQWEPAEPFGFTKGTRVMRMPAVSGWMNPWRHGTLLYDLETDPGQEQPIIDDAIELRMLELLQRLLIEAEAPASQFERLGLPREHAVTRDHLLARSHADRARELLEPLLDAPELLDDEMLNVPISALLSDPRRRTAVGEHIPGLGTTELVAVPSDLSLLDLARRGFLSVEQLHAAARALQSTYPQWDSNPH
jgi:hypothetical protein